MAHQSRYLHNNSTPEKRPRWTLGMRAGDPEKFNRLNEDLWRRRLELAEDAQRPKPIYSEQDRQVMHRDLAAEEVEHRKINIISSSCVMCMEKYREVALELASVKEVPSVAKDAKASLLELDNRIKSDNWGISSEVRAFLERDKERRSPILSPTERREMEAALVEHDNYFRLLSNIFYTGLRYLGSLSLRILRAVNARKVLLSGFNLALGIVFNSKYIRILSHISFNFARLHTALAY